MKAKCHIFVFLTFMFSALLLKPVLPMIQVQLFLWIKTTPGKKRVGIRDTLIGLRLLLADAQSQDKEMDKWDSGWPTT